jgi:hypothetical protein
MLGVALAGCTAETTDPVAAGRSGSNSGRGSGGAGSGATADGGINFDGSSKGSGTSAGVSGSSCNGLLVAYVRDFMESHPDMEKFGQTDHAAYTTDKGIVTNKLGEDQKPVFNKVTNTTTDASNFWQWYNDVDGVNLGFEHNLQFSELEPGTWEYASTAFFPADGQGFKELSGTDNQGVQHNYHFTLELHTLFTYDPGQRFHFTGDDDVFAYMNGQLVVDLGGVHQTQRACVWKGAARSDAECNGPDDWAFDTDQLGLVAGETYPLDFFFAERHVTESNFTIRTSLAFTKCDIIIK